MILCMILRLDDKSDRGFSKYEYRLLYAGLSIAMIRDKMPKDFSLRIFCDKSGVEFAERMGVPRKDLFYHEIAGFHPKVSDSVIGIMISAGMSEGLPDPFLVFSDGTIITDFEGLRNNQFIFWTSTTSKIARNTGDVDEAYARSEFTKGKEPLKFYNCAVMGGVSSPVWINMSNILNGMQDVAMKMNEIDISVFVSSFLNGMELKEFSISGTAVRAPLHSRGNYTEDDMSNVRRRLKHSYRDVELALEKYMTDKQIF